MNSSKRRSAQLGSYPILNVKPRTANDHSLPEINNIGRITLISETEQNGTYALPVMIYHHHPE
jgi:hypothetical protein